MAPTRKKSVNKRFLSEVSPDKEVKNSKKNKQLVTGRKKLSDKLGHQWSKEELQRFYKAYRQYGKDWKKVAAEVHNRSVEMVEGLYNMNRAYLSLPEGMASVVGLIAMMTDHYSVLEESDSEQESDEVMEMFRKLQKRKRPKVQLSATKEDGQQCHSVVPLPAGGCLSLLKRGRFDGGQPRAVGKRTPRFPVSYQYKKDGTENYVSSLKKCQKLDIDANDDTVAHVAALALAEASKRRGFPQVSEAPHRRTEHIESSPVKSLDRMFPKSGSALAKHSKVSISEKWLQGDMGSRWNGIGAYAKDASFLADMEGIGTVEVHRKGKKFYGKKVKVQEVGNSQSDDGGEACSGTEEGQKVGALKGKVNIEVSDAKIDEISRRGQRKRNKKPLPRDEFSTLNPLQTLADVFVMDSALDVESSIQLNEESTAHEVDGKSSSPEATSSSRHRENIKLSRQKDKKIHAKSGVEDTFSRQSKLGKYSAVHPTYVSEAKQRPQSPSNNILKRKRQASVSMASGAEDPGDSHLSKLLETGVLDEEENNVIKGKRTGQISPPSKQLKPSGVLDGSSPSGDQKSPSSDLAVSTTKVPGASQVILPTGNRSRCKMDLKRALILKEEKNIPKNQANKCSISLQERTLCLKEKLSCCLSSSMVRRWCTFEWFYSAIDYPWFAKREFVEYLNHVGLGHVPKLTRVEWGVIRSSLGKPRRFSERFLYEEREKLQLYRESVRKHYAELRTGIREGLPTDLARPLSVGQRVTAIHPKTRELHDGSVLTIDHDRCRVQFDHPEIGVEFVKDIDCMPLNPLDNMPEALKRHRLSVASKDLQMSGHTNVGGITSSEHLQNSPSPLNASVKQAQVEANHAIQQAKVADINDVNAPQIACSQPSVVEQNHVKESDIQALSELNRALDKKESWLMDLKNSSNDTLQNQNIGGNPLKDSESFKKHLATVLVQLKEAGGQASSALLNLRQHNTYPGNTLLPPLKPPANSSSIGSLLDSHDSSFVSQESGSTVVDIVRGSRLKAHTMVDAAVQAILSLKEGEDAYVRIKDAFDSKDKRQLVSESRAQVIRSPEQVNGSIRHHNQLISTTSEPQGYGNASVSKSHHDSDKIKAAIPSELISSCVSTMLMIQTCTERQYPPADVAQIIDSAVTSLRPCCPQNLQIYREIQMCMGRIKTQILALIPT